MRPPVRHVRTLRVLGRALAAPETIHGAQSWQVTRRGAVRWDDVLDLAESSGVAPALWHALRGDLAALPPAGAERLREAHRANTVRNLRLREQLRVVTGALNGAGIEPLLFKGALDLACAGPGAIGERSMADLDLAVAPEQLSAATSALEAVGYTPTPGKAFLHPHELPFRRAGATGPIELHTMLGSPPIPTLLPLRGAWVAATELELGAGARARGLAPTDQVLHNILHSAVQDLNHAVHGLPLRQLAALARLERIHRDAIDWVAVQDRMTRAALGRVLHDHVWLAHRIVGMPLPAGVRGDRHARRHEAAALAAFSLGWPPEVQRNLRFALGRAYLDSLYHHHDRPLLLLWARCRHSLTVLRRTRRPGRRLRGR